MNADEYRLKIDELTYRINGCIYEVANVLGHGFLEKVYENALACELRNQKFRVEQQKPLPVLYKGNMVGDYFADLLVENTVLIELKSITTSFQPVHLAQCMNYLRATNLHVCLLVNFGKPKVEIKRVVRNL
ncbi:MAG: GxxExxY protein [Sumerlaeia bacterium]